MKRGKSALLAAACALAVLTVAPHGVLAQTPPKDSGASMVKPPDAAGTSNPANPDNMPVKRPPAPTHDKMTHEPPASAAVAK
jgi:hypothetical protein